MSGRANTGAEAEASPFSSGEEREAGLRLAMFAFLASEALLFAGLFALYIGYRAAFPVAFAMGVSHNEEWIGSVNTLILLSSSFVVAWGELCVKHGRERLARWSLALACVLGLSFLSLKTLEYVHHWERGIRPGAAYAYAELTEPGASIFFSLYYFATGLHALHLTLGVLALGWLAGMLRSTPAAKGRARVELAALYWHFVDIVWIFLWPMLYLMR